MDVNELILEIGSWSSSDCLLALVFTLKSQSLVYPLIRRVNNSEPHMSCCIPRQLALSVLSFVPWM